MQRATAWLCNTRRVSGSNAQQAASLCHVRHQSSGPTQQTKPTAAGAGTASQGANGLLPMQPDVPAGPIYPPSPQHRKVVQ